MNLLVKLPLLAVCAAALVGCESRSSSMAGPVICTTPQQKLVAQPGGTTPGRVDLTGRTRLGKASFYARSFAHRQMADGERMDPQGDNAASRTLPLGTTAKVINVKTGQSAVVSIEDRGPYVKGRLIDLSPATARSIGITARVGVAEVKVAPIAVPQPDGTLKIGAAAAQRPVCKVVRS